LLPGEFGQPMSFLSLVMDAFGGLPNLLGKLLSSRQHAADIRLRG
jgi:hypothetical protein